MMKPSLTRCQRRHWFSLGTLILWVSTALSAAASSAVDMVASPRGHLIAVGGGPGGAGAACFSCHGLHSQGDTGGAFPRLAGLDAHYLAKQMNDYAAGGRSNEAMTRIAQQLSQVDRQSVALYYAGLVARAPLFRSTADASLIQRGATLYAQGSIKRGIQSCGNCHGSGG